MINSFSKWLDTFIDEKGIDLNHTLTAEGPSGTNWIPVAVLVEMMKNTSPQEQAGIKSMIVRIDFHAGDVLDYFSHLAKAVAA
mgnify:CR=1 FL=1